MLANLLWIVARVYSYQTFVLPFEDHQADKRIYVTLWRQLNELGEYVRIHRASP